MTPHETELFKEFKRGSPEAIAKFNSSLDGMKLSAFFDLFYKGMVNFVHRHCGKPIEELRSDVNEHNATIAELLRRVASLESERNG